MIARILLQRNLLILILLGLLLIRYIPIERVAVTFISNILFATVYLIWCLVLQISFSPFAQIALKIPQGVRNFNVLYVLIFLVFYNSLMSIDLPGVPLVLLLYAIFCCTYTLTATARILGSSEDTVSPLSREMALILLLLFPIGIFYFSHRFKQIKGIV